MKILIFTILLVITLFVPYTVFAQEFPSVNSSIPIDSCGKMFIINPDNSINYDGTKLIMTIQNYSIPIPSNYHATGVMPQDTLSSAYINNIFTITGKSLQNPMPLHSVLNRTETYRITISNIGDKPATFTHYYLDYTITSLDNIKTSQNNGTMYYAYPSYGTEPLAKNSHHNGKDVTGSNILRESDPSFGYMETPDTGWQSSHLNPNESIAVIMPVEYYDMFTPRQYPHGIGNYTIEATTIIGSMNDTCHTRIYSQPIDITLSFQDDKYKIPEFPFAVPILLISIVSIIAFYKMKFGALK